MSERRGEAWSLCSSGSLQEMLRDLEACEDLDEDLAEDLDDMLDNLNLDEDTVLTVMRKENQQAQSGKGSSYIAVSGNRKAQAEQRQQFMKSHEGVAARSGYHSRSRRNSAIRPEAPMRFRQQVRSTNINENNGTRYRRQALNNLRKRNKTPVSAHNIQYQYSPKTKDVTSNENQCSFADSDEIHKRIEGLISQYMAVMSEKARKEYIHSAGLRARKEYIHAAGLKASTSKDKDREWDKDSASSDSWDDSVSPREYESTTGGEREESTSDEGTARRSYMLPDNQNTEHDIDSWLDAVSAQGGSPDSSDEDQNELEHKPIKKSDLDEADALLKELDAEIVCSPFKEKKETIPMKNKSLSTNQGFISSSTPPKSKKAPIIVAFDQTCQLANSSERSPTLSSFSRKCLRGRSHVVKSSAKSSSKDSSDSAKAPTRNSSSRKTFRKKSPRTSYFPVLNSPRSTSQMPYAKETSSGFQKCSSAVGGPFLQDVPSTQKNSQDEDISQGISIISKIRLKRSLPPLTHHATKSFQRGSWSFIRKSSSSETASQRTSGSDNEPLLKVSSLHNKFSTVKPSATDTPTVVAKVSKGEERSQPARDSNNISNHCMLTDSRSDEAKVCADVEATALNTISLEGNEVYLDADQLVEARALTPTCKSDDDSALINQTDVVLDVNDQELQLAHELLAANVQQEEIKKAITQHSIALIKFMNPFSVGRDVSGVSVPVKFHSVYGKIAYVEHVLRMLARQNKMMKQRKIGIMMKFLEIEEEKVKSIVETPIERKDADSSESFDFEDQKRKRVLRLHQIKWNMKWHKREVYNLKKGVLQNNLVQIAIPSQLSTIQEKVDFLQLKILGFQDLARCIRRQRQRQFIRRKLISIQNILIRVRRFKKPAVKEQHPESPQNYVKDDCSLISIEADVPQSQVTSSVSDVAVRSTSEENFDSTDDDNLEALMKSLTPDEIETQQATTTDKAESSEYLLQTHEFPCDHCDTRKYLLDVTDTTVLLSRNTKPVVRYGKMQPNARRQLPEEWVATTRGERTSHIGADRSKWEPLNAKANEGKHEATEALDSTAEHGGAIPKIPAAGKCKPHKVIKAEEDTSDAGQFLTSDPTKPAENTMDNNKLCTSQFEHKTALDLFDEKMKYLEELNVDSVLFDFEDRKATLYEKLMMKKLHGIAVSSKYLPPAGQFLEERITGLKEGHKDLNEFLELDSLHQKCIMFKHLGDELIRLLKLAHCEVSGDKNMYFNKDLEDEVEFSLSCWKKPVTEIVLKGYKTRLNIKISQLSQSLNALSQDFATVTPENERTPSSLQDVRQKRSPLGGLQRKTPVQKKTVATSIEPVTQAASTNHQVNQDDIDDDIAELIGLRNNKYARYKTPN